jgi:hypothetical protein
MLLISVAVSCQSAHQDDVLHCAELTDIDSGRVWLGYERGIPVQKALRMFDHLIPAPERARKTKLYKIPNTDTYLASIHGQQLVQLRVTDTSIAELFRSSSLDWSWIIEPCFYIGDSSVIVIAQFGEEHFEGFLVLESKNGSLKQLDQCDFVPLDSDSAYASPIDFIRVRRSDSTYFLNFPVDLVLNPLTQQEAVLQCPKGQQISFRYNGARFVRTR